MLNLGAKNSSLRVINDQFGCPTYGPDIAKSIVRVLDSLESMNTRLLYHYSGFPSCSWLQFANSIFEEAHENNKLTKRPFIVSVSSEEYANVAAPRPKNSILDSSKFLSDFGCKPSLWLNGVRSLVQSKSRF